MLHRVSWAWRLFYLPARVSKVLASACGRASAVSRHKDRSESPSCAFATNSYNVNSTTDSSEKEVKNGFVSKDPLKAKPVRVYSGCLYFQKEHQLYICWPKLTESSGRSQHVHTTTYRQSKSRSYMCKTSARLK